MKNMASSRGQKDNQRALAPYISIERRICHVFSIHSNSPKLPFFFILLQCSHVAYLKLCHSQWHCQNTALGSKSEVSSSVLFLSAGDKGQHSLAGVFWSTVRRHSADAAGWTAAQAGGSVPWGIPLFLKEFFCRYKGKVRSPFLYHSLFDTLPPNFKGIKGTAAGFWVCREKC